MKKADAFYQLWIIVIVLVFGLLLSHQNAAAYTLQFARVEYRHHTDPGKDHTRFAVMFTDEAGNYVDPHISGATITYMGQPVEYSNSWEGGYYALYGSYDESAGSWRFDDALTYEYYIRAYIAPSNTFADAAAPAGTYSLSIVTDDGTYTKDLNFSGKQDLPAIDETTFQFSLNQNGDLTISWTLPDQSLFPSGASLLLYLEDAGDWTMAGYFSMPLTVNSITIPKEKLVLLGSPDAYNVYMRTQNQDRTSRAYSDTVTVETTDIPIVTDAVTGGYNVTGELWAKAVLQVATTPVTPVTLVWKQVGADTTPSGDRVISGYFYADPAGFAYGSPYNPEVFVKIYIATSGWCNLAFNHVTVDDVTIYSAHHYNGAVDQTGTASTVNRLVEHQYTGVGDQQDND